MDLKDVDPAFGLTKEAKAVLISRHSHGYWLWLGK
jgi:hypothetical protein